MQAGEGRLQQAGPLGGRAGWGGAPFAVGDTFSGVDILLTSCLDWAVAYGFDLTPALDAYRTRHHERPAYRAAAELNYSIQTRRLRIATLPCAIGLPAPRTFRKRG